MSVVFASLRDSDVARLLASGAVGVIPTDTVYGVVARAADPVAAGRVHQAKHREGKPGTIIAADVAQLVALGLDSALLDRAAHLWPNPISVIIPASPELAYLHLGMESLAVRVPLDDDVHELLTRTGPLITSSANLAGQPPANTLAEAQNYFGDTVDFYVDGGDLSGGLPSTLTKLLPDGTLEVLRQGNITVQNKEKAP